MKKLLVDTMYDSTKIILPNIYVQSYLNLYVTLQNACELTKFWGGLEMEKLKNVYHFTSYNKFKIWWVQKIKHLVNSTWWCVWSVITHNIWKEFLSERWNSNIIKMLHSHLLIYVTTTTSKKFLHIV